MRIREIEFYNFRCFRGHRRFSFVDPLTDAVRPVTVLAGSNGSGKTTILEAINAMLDSVIHPESQPELLREAKDTGAIRLAVELTSDEISPASRKREHNARGEPHILNLVVGRRHLGPDVPGTSGLRRALQLAVSAMEKGQDPLRGGVLFFPHDRRLNVVRSAVIEEVPSTNEWIFRFTPSDKWQGSLQQLWAWQDYRDLADFRQRMEEASAHDRTIPDRPNLGPFVSSIESVLGQGRTIVVSDGHPYVSVPWAAEGSKTRVRLDQLPSGEQQILLLFGELARRRRPGAVIMIDEVENSLHPTLQRLVMWNLRRIAREWDAQVIVATHSLEVIHSVRGGAFINLDHPQDQFDLPVPIEDEEPAP